MTKLQMNRFRKKLLVRNYYFSITIFDPKQVLSYFASLHPRHPFGALFLARFMLEQVATDTTLYIRLFLRLRILNQNLMRK